MAENQAAYESEEKTSIAREKSRYIEVSGTDEYGHSKAHVILSYIQKFSDGTDNTLQEITISRKVIVSIFRHADAVNVWLDFRSENDADLNITWNLLQEYARPENSIDWTEEEMERGTYIGEDGNEYMIFYPMLELAISPVQKETEFMILGMNPLTFTLAPNNPKSREACVLQFTFAEEWFHVSENLNVDLYEIHQEVMNEIEAEMMTPSAQTSQVPESE